MQMTNDQSLAAESCGGSRLVSDQDRSKGEDCGYSRQQQKHGQIQHNIQLNKSYQYLQLQ